ncbi:MAG: Do family serine endopeptidase [Deferrisomatales bacterium]|nr:Do family serine endopeptidase [Deferrisomatales bacterium]
MARLARFPCVLCIALVLGAASAAVAAPDPRETPVVLAVRRAAPAVVNVSTEIVTREANPFGARNPFFDEFFRDFFGDVPPRKHRERSLGSGVIIAADGTILTNEHVVANATRISVTLAGGVEYEARLVGADARTDLAVLRVEADQPLPTVALGTSADLLIGETVIAIGNPFGLSHTVTTGVVSAVNRTIRGGDDQVYTDFIQTDAAINPGNSGGPLLNIRGEMVGVNAAIYQRAEGVGFAIPVDKARRIAENLITYGEVHRAWLGVHVQDLTPELARHFGVAPAGVLVSRVFAGGPGEEGGLRRGDILVGLDERPLADRESFFERLAGYTAGSRLAFRALRDGKAVALTVRAREIPTEYVERLSRTWLGIAVEENSRQLAGRHGLSTAAGLVVTEVVPGGAAARIGLEPGDVVLQVNDTGVGDAASYREALLRASQRETVVLVVQRGRARYHVTLSP